MTQRYWTFISLVCLGCLLLAACEEEFDLPNVSFEPQIIVEGYIEAYKKDCDLCIEPTTQPAYVILTKSFAINEAFGEEEFEDSFVRGAEVSIKFGQDSIFLEDICLSELDPELRTTIIQRLGLTESLLGLDFSETEYCAYIDLSFASFEFNQQYDLRIALDSQIITATTTIPTPVTLDSISFRIPPGDTEFFKGLRQMLIYVDVPDSTRHFFRYFTQQNDKPMYKGNSSLSFFKSVFDDEIIKNFTAGVPLQKGEPRDSTFNTGSNRFGNFNRNDRYLLKWCTIDETHFNFWNSTEFNALNQGLFSSYTQTQSNIQGGIGVWGGYAVSFYGGKIGK